MTKDDLTTGPMALHFKNLAIPAALGMLFTTLYNVVDVYYAGQLSTEAQPHLIALVSEPGGYRDAAQGYFNILIFALPGFFMTFAGNGILQAHGDSVSMQRAMMVAFVVNIGLNPLMMYTVGLGFNGIAVSTVLCQTGVMVFIFTRVFSLPTLGAVKRPEFAPDKTSYRAIIKQMLPTSTAMLVMFMSGFVVQFALKGFGESAIAAYGVALRIEQILLLPVLGMTGALLPIAGQNFGAENFDRVRAALAFCWKIGFAISLIAAPCLWFGGAWAISLFTDDAAVIATGASYLRVDAILFPIYMMLFSINSLLQALQRPIWTLWISIYRQGFGVALGIWVFISLLGFDVLGVWLGIAAAVTSGWIIALLVANHVANQEIGGLRTQA